MANNRTFWAVQSIGFRPSGGSTYTLAHGVQSVGITASFNLEQFFELGQISIYENVEDIPDIEVTAEKVLDGYPLLYHLATPGATSASLVGRSTAKCDVAFGVFPDTNNSASGDAIAECYMSGMFISSLEYNIPVEGNCTESVTLVGNHRLWYTGAALLPTGIFTNADQPFSYPNSGGIQRRENVRYDYSYAGLDANGMVTGNGTVLPRDIAGVTSSGTIDLDDANRAHVQNIRVSANLNRESLFELGRKSPYFRYVTFPIEVTTEVEILATSGDWVEATEEGVKAFGSNLDNQSFQVHLQDSTKISTGVQNKLNNMSYSGGGTDGGNVTVTYTYVTQNDMTVTHTNDPAGL